nr:MAG TPA: hypothetical protein [Caudoviricetes sp.]
MEAVEDVFDVAQRSRDESRKHEEWLASLATFLIPFLNEEVL